MKNYTLEIQKHRDAIDQLQVEQSLAYKNNLPNLVGVCLKPSVTSRYKILEVEEADEDTIYCTVLNVYKSEDDVKIEKEISFSIAYPHYYDIITPGEFNVFLQEAIIMVNDLSK